MKCHFTFSHSDWTKLYVSRKILFDRKKDNDLYILCKRSCCVDQLQQTLDISYNIEIFKQFLFECFYCQNLKN